MRVMSLTAHHGVIAAPRMREVDVQGSQAFLQACSASGAPRRVRLPTHAIDALVAANVDYFAADSFGAAVYRALRLPFCGPLSAKRAVRCVALRQLYTRFNNKRPREFRPCAVEPVVRASLMAIIRRGDRAVDVDSLAADLDDELRRFPGGILLLRGPLGVVRACVYTVAIAAVMSIALTAVVTFNRAANAVPALHKVDFAVRQFALLTALAGATAIAFACARERDKARSLADWSVPGGATLFLTALILLTVLA